MTQIPQNVRQTFLTGLKSKSRHAAALPDPLPVDRVLSLVIEDRVDTEERDDDHTRIRVGQEQDAYYLDYLVERRRGYDTFTWHGRIHQDGREELLESYEGEFGRALPDDPQEAAVEDLRITAHNERVDRILRDKGFR